VPLAAEARGLVVAGLATALLTALVVTDQLRPAPTPRHRAHQR